MNKDFLDLLVKLKKAEEIPTPPSEPYPDELLNKTTALYKLGMGINVARERYEKLTDEKERKEFVDSLNKTMLGVNWMSARLTDEK